MHTTEVKYWEQESGREQESGKHRILRFVINVFTAFKVSLLKIKMFFFLTTTKVICFINVISIIFNYVIIHLNL